ncbi:xanthine dehydrogenase protein [Fulvimarina pelagi HTCC2506]|uniref:Xanthine dehydrogenase protein n=1 Tax=Fulvimarina pelagi HTCC2506 TaxID=314231 RepID=Q0FXY7_9HYPH|nr:xanthine dehydrogenase accessory protein XdhC [Fulvimarina pelagi]EAU39955.1 xanthine dehydrogenase protein [Fulvimarina pelagi HTCC2506]
MKQDAILVTITRAYGSTPREAGAAMMVTSDHADGTIGGGRLEFDAIETARQMLATGATREERSVPLGPEIGQCCGGRVDLLFERADETTLSRRRVEAASRDAMRPNVFLFGAGHTGRALALALAPLPLNVTLVDPRSETLAGLPESIRTVAAAMPETMVADAPSDAAFVVMTHDHALDFLIAAEALRRRDTAYVGMIGSATKRARFKTYLREIGLEAEISRLTLPVGGSALRDKRPEVIAAMTAAELCTCLLSGQQKTMPVRLADAVL